MAVQILRPGSDIPGVKALVKSLFEHIRPVKPLSLADWNEAHRQLSRENSAMPGKYRLEMTPWLREPMECYTDAAYDAVVFLKSTQVGYTEGMTNGALCYHIDHDPTSVLVLFPTDKTVERYSKEKFDPMVRDNPRIRDKISKAKSRDSYNTLTSKYFDGGHVQFVGSNSPADLASSPIRIVIVEEPDRCARNSGKEGNSLKLAYERQATFPDAKRLLGGSPTIKNLSEIQREYDLSDQREFYIPCPKCRHYQTLDWSMVVWKKDEDAEPHPVFGRHKPTTARFKCKKCKKLFNDSEKNRVVTQGKWIAKYKGRRVAGFRINALYSKFPKAKLSYLVERFLEAKRYLDLGDPSFMITFTNTALAECWSEKGDELEEDVLREKAEDYDGIPYGPCVLVASVDVQDDRLELLLKGYGRDFESWNIDYKIFRGDPGQKIDEEHSVWWQLDQYLLKVRKNPSGMKMPVQATAIDSGGHYTDQVYRFCKARWYRRVIAIKGSGTAGLPILGKPSVRNRFRCRLFILGSNNIKDMVATRLAKKKHGAGYIHTPNHFPDEWFKGLTTEHRVTRYRQGHAYQVWELKYKGASNEPWDLECYCIAALDFLNPELNALADKFDEIAESGMPAVPQPRTTEQPNTQGGRPERRRSSYMRR